MAEPLDILIPLDGSPASEAILPALLPLLRTRSVRVTLLQAVPLRAAERAARRFLEAARADLARDGVDASLRVEVGRPAIEILRAAGEGCDLIALATHGRGGTARLLMGGTAEEVVRRAPVPVLLSREETRVGDWKRIVAAVDGTAGSEEILEGTARLAAGLGATVHLVRVDLPLVDPEGGEAACPDSMPYLRRLCDRLAARGVFALPEPRCGLAAEEIVRAARELGAGLVCTGTEGREGHARSVAAQLIRTAPCPVLVRRTSPVMARAF